ncbi:MAG TPA: hypothetical protein QGH10_16955, partial [Armatimonadota bacterium]|nr:hypothetical protein [Armatimonadota bacterium]
MRHRPVGALLGCAIACASAAAQPGKISVPIAVEAVAVSEAPEGASDSNWVVGNIVDGTWASPPYYPDLQWMARHIGQPGFDIWCRLELGEERTVHEVDLQNTGFGAFVHLKDIRLVFSDGTTRDIVMAQDDERQTFAFDPTPTEWVEIHLLSHYGDGAGINENSGGFAEVALFETRAAPGLGRHDLDGDGRSYLLVCLWQDHVAAFIADDGSLPWTDDWDRDWDAYLDQAHNVGENPPVTWNPMRGAWGSYTLLVDREDDGDFDGDEDYWYQVIDLDGDGDPDIERTDRYVGWGELVKYNFDLDDDNRSNNLAWSVPGYGDEQACTTEGNYVSDRAGNGFFLQGWLNMRGEIYSDTRAAWENPIAWYDLDDDGSTEMVVRVTDTHGRCEGT